MSKRDSLYSPHAQVFENTLLRNWRLRIREGEGKALEELLIQESVGTEEGRDQIKIEESKNLDAGVSTPELRSVESADDCTKPWVPWDDN